MVQLSSPARCLHLQSLSGLRVLLGRAPLLQLQCFRMYSVQKTSPWSPPPTAGESGPWWLGHLLLLVRPYVCRSASLTFCLTLLCHTVFCPFLNKVSQRCHHLCWADSAISYSGLFGESLHQLCPFQYHVLLSKTWHINTILHLTTVRTYLTTGVKIYIHQTINYMNKSNSNKNSLYKNQSNIISILEKVDNSHTYCEGQPLLPSLLYNNKYSSTISLLFSNIQCKCCLLPWIPQASFRVLKSTMVSLPLPFTHSPLFGLWR